MGIEKIGTKLLRPTVERWAKKFGTKIIQTKPNIFHGINPTATYLPSGKTFALPRFCTVEMREARQMNKIAILQAKAQGIVRTYPKATAQDLRRLTSETLEDSYSWVMWTNPNDGKVYNLLKQGETEDGKVIVRILDEEGAFVKEAQLTPKKIKIYDSDKNKVNFGNYYEELSHGEVVTRFTRRANPFADIEYINIAHERAQNTTFSCYDNLVEEFNKLHKSLLEGEKVDYISLSIGLNPKSLSPQRMLEKTGKSLLEFKTSVDTFPTSKFIQMHPNLRILQSAGNYGKETISPDLMFKYVEGVGALAKNGKIADFSASRSRILTQHYEQGIFSKHSTKYGLGYFDQYSTDIVLKPEFLKRAQSYIGKKPVVVQDAVKRMDELKDIAQKKYKAEFERVRKSVVTIDEENELNRLLQIFRNENNPEKKEIASKQYWDYYRKLHDKVKKEMLNYENPEGILYKKNLEYIESHGLLRGDSVHGYSTFDRSPYEMDIDNLTFIADSEGRLVLSSFANRIFPLQGTSFSTPIRTAKLALNAMMEGIL